MPVRCLVRIRAGSGPERVSGAAGDRRSGRSGLLAKRAARRGHRRAPRGRRPRPAAGDGRGAQRARRLAAAARRRASRRRHFVWITPLGATPHHPMRMQRAKALAAARDRGGGIPTTTLAHSLMYAPGDRHLRWLERLGYLPAVPLVGRGIARTQPIWAEDMADAVLAALERAGRPRRYELAGPETLTQREVVRLVLARGRRRRRAARSRWPGCEPRCGPRRRSPARRRSITWDEAQLLAVEMLSARGTQDAEALGVTPRRMAAVLGAGAPKGARFQLRGDLQQPVLVERPADDLDADRQAVCAEPDRQRDRGLPRDVEQRRVGREEAGAVEVAQRVLARSRCTRRSAAAAPPARASSAGRSRRRSRRAPRERLQLRQRPM